MIIMKVQNFNRVILILCVLITSHFISGCSNGSLCVPAMIADNSEVNLLYQIPECNDKSNIYIQKIGSTGEHIWSNNGILIGNAYSVLSNELGIISDDSNGYFTAFKSRKSEGEWDRKPNDSILESFSIVTKIGNDGELIWKKDVHNISKPEKIIQDNVGGIILSQDDFNQRSIILQRIGSTGDFPWGEEGVKISSGLGYNPYSYRLTNIGRDRVIVSWEEVTQDESSSIKIQIISPEGDYLCGETGVDLYTTSNLIIERNLINDGLGGVIIVWVETNWGWPRTSHNLFAYRIDSDGNHLWESPVIVQTENDFGRDMRSRQRMISSPLILNDGLGIYILWLGSGTIYVQRLSLNGDVVWNDANLIWDGGQLGSLSYDACAVDSGGIILTWWYIPDEYFYNKSSIIKSSLLRAQRISIDGEILWSNDGVSVAPSNNEYPNYASISSNGNGISFILFGTDNDIHKTRKFFVQKIEHNGTLSWGSRGIRINP
jgi:hypothetical protein